MRNNSRFFSPWGAERTQTTEIPKMKILVEISLKSDIVLRLNWRSHQHSTQHGRFSNEHHRSPIQSLTGILTCPSASRNNCLTRCAHSPPSYAVWTSRLARMHRARPTSQRSCISFRTAGGRGRGGTIQQETSFR